MVLVTVATANELFHYQLLSAIRGPIAVVRVSRVLFVFSLATAALYISDVTGADPGFWERGGLINIFTTGGGYGRGISPSCDSKGVWGSADSSPSGVWGEAPAAFLLLRLFSM